MKLPSVMTTTRWIELQQAKENEKSQAEEIKVQKRKLREETQLKLKEIKLKKKETKKVKDSKPKNIECEKTMKKAKPTAIEKPGRKVCS